MEEGVTRIGVSLPKNLLDEFDSIIRTRGYSSRSEAIRDAIRNYIAEYKWLEKEEGEIVGVVTILYNHHYKGTSDAIISLQHDFGDVITTTLHIHLNEDSCLEMVIVKGDMAKIKRLVDKITTIKGVNNVKLITALKE
ncbi:nickel-responsive transcriptional regulator NikR [Archaeoglobus veneficus]|uniref:Putative nickel-responsive regulator n=1 Tax=Archaeoglobus veneficus (strain DSM 11195 / SNP6) TaxID=693661 RepID=F2KNN0_ARCVS|nr:nickel-responsive transcriptional regulator NikR [Archaeoglobus veneficus]AEA46258.1 transcriptional regulator NikR, CopG family [Archaeoglobus veneficus SNP6]